ncbi:hydrogenase expression protein HypA [Streptomyces sp. NPDC005065]|uniref:hydrogenase expression protein HypA n=1 Tax=unclassified Streptomyces TaxID=2593676 RepID=UPI0033A5DB78
MPESQSGAPQFGAPQVAATDTAVPTTSASGTGQRAAAPPAATIAAAQSGDTPHGITAARTAASGAGNGPDENLSNTRSRPNKPILAGAAIVGVILVTLPLLLVGANKHEEKKTQVEPLAAGSQADTVLDGNDPKDSGNYVVESPSPSPSPTVSKSKSSKPASARPATSAHKSKVRNTAAAVAAKATASAKPPQSTAASAVNQLAKNDPGRHICYRAYVSGQGWQKPVCDGTMAGTTNQNHPIKALNVAMSGSGGSSANAFVHNPTSTDGNGKWMPQWTDIKGDGTNNYIGSTKKGAPNMSGFAINVGTGRICQLAKIHSLDWNDQGCADARPGYTFGGALRNDRYLEAVKLTV